MKNILIFEDFTDLYKRWKKKEVRKEDKDNTRYIDLGLPSGTLWADRNIGAIEPEDEGDFYAWGETEPKKEYLWDTYKWGEDCTKYNKKDGKTVLEPEDDVVYLKTKGKAHIPTKEQMRELLDNTTAENQTVNGVDGILYKSKVNSNTIFLPFVGECDNHIGRNMWSNYWSSSLDLSNHHGVHKLYNSRQISDIFTKSRCAGFSVRGVKDK